MRRVLVQDQHHGITPALHEGFEEFQEQLLVEFLLEDLEPELPTRAHRGDRVDRLTPSAGADLRRVPLGRPGATQHRVGANPRFVAEEDLRAARRILEVVDQRCAPASSCCSSR